MFCCVVLYCIIFHIELHQLVIENGYYHSLKFLIYLQKKREKKVQFLLILFSLLPAKQIFKDGYSWK